MTQFNKPLDNPINWSFRVGRLFGIDIRVHIAFVLCAVVLLWMELPKPDAHDPRGFGRVLLDVFGMYAILFAVVLMHELGHCFGARRVGGEAKEILLWPLGGLATANVPHNATAHMVTTVAGPLVNVVFCAITSSILVLWLGRLGAVPWNPLHPTWPIDASIFPTTGQIWLMRFFGINYVLLLFNLLPIYPFDGGRMLQAWLWPGRGYRGSMEIATGIGMVGSIMLGLFGLFTGQGWLLMMIAVFGYANCWYTRRMLKEETMLQTGEFGYDFSQGYAAFDSEEERKPGYWVRRRARRAAAKARRTREREEVWQREIETILRKVADSGMDSLTTQERRMLERETLRRRQAENPAERSGRTE